MRISDWSSDVCSSDLLDIIREAAATLPRALIAVSCSKAFGLYRERVGILFALCVDADERARVQGQMERISRSLVSMPPAHGAGTVARVLHDPPLRTLWEEDLAAMPRRLLALRTDHQIRTAPCRERLRMYF